MMENSFINRGYKDVIFKDIFSRREFLVQLVNALNNSNCTAPEDLEITTIESIIYVTMKNDISFLIGSEMNLFEQQSTYNPNMPLRGLMYFAQLYQEYLTKRDLELYGTTLTKIPTPNFIVFYNGTRDVPEQLKLKLSDSFLTPVKSGEFEWTATMLNINGDNNQQLKAKCPPLLEYSKFVDIINQERKNKSPVKPAVEKALNFAIKQNFLGGYFKQCKMEVMNMSLTEFDKEAYDKCMRNEGRAEAKIESAKNLLKMNLLTYEQISQATNLSVDVIKELASKLK